MQVWYSYLHNDLEGTATSRLHKGLEVAQTLGRLSILRYEWGRPHLYFSKLA